MTKAKLETALTILFYILVLATLVCYFVYPSTPRLFISIGITALVVRAITYLIRLIK